MEALLLARIQFAFTIGFHYLFPPVTIGLSLVIVIIEGRVVFNGSFEELRNSRDTEVLLFLAPFRTSLYDVQKKNFIG